MDLDGARLQLDPLAVPRQIIGPFALNLDRGILRRDLFDQSGEAGQERLDRLGRRPDPARPDDAALGIVGVALFAPGNREAVALTAVHHEGYGLGGFADRNRQSARGERVQRSGVACALGLEQALHDGDRMGGGHADRLVENDPAMHVALFASRLVVRPHLLLARIVVDSPRLVARSGKNVSFRRGRIAVLRLNCVIHNHRSSSRPGARSLCTAGVLSNFSIRSASSNRSSIRKRTSGANFRLTRWAISPRRNRLWRLSAAITTSVSRPPSGIT